MVKMITIEKFLCRWRLEDGGNFIGWFSAVFAVIAFIALIVSFTLSLVAFFARTSEDQNKVLPQSILFLSIMAIFMFYLMISFYGAIRTIQGVKKRSHRHVRLLKYLMPGGAFLSFMQMFFDVFIGTASAIIIALILLYFFVVLHSLSELYRSENEAEISAY